MSLSIPGLSPPQPAALQRQDEVRTRSERIESAGGTPRPQVDEPDADQWIPRADAAGPEPPTYAAPVDTSGGGTVAAPRSAPSGPDAAALAAESLRRAMQARPQQAVSAQGNLVAATVLNLLA